MEKQLSIRGLDTARGIYLTGGTISGYLETLALYCANAESYLSDFPGAPDEERLSAFTIRVHALKSASASVGAQSLSQEAAILEEAGKTGNQVVIQERFGVFNGELSQLTERIRGELKGADSSPIVREAL